MSRIPDRERTLGWLVAQGLLAPDAVVQWLARQS